MLALECSIVNDLKDKRVKKQAHKAREVTTVKTILLGWEGSYFIQWKRLA